MNITLNPIKVGTRWEQQQRPTLRGKKRVRIIEVISAPTLSNAVGYRVIRNDVHPHRKGKIASIRIADLHRKYEAVAA